MESAYLMFGPPGTGKTTWLKSQVDRARDAFGSSKVLVSSFTRAGAHEIASRLEDMPERNVGTLHGICYHALGCPELVEGNENLWNDLDYDWKLTVHRKGSKRKIEDSDGESDRIEEPFDGGPHNLGDKLREQVDICRVKRLPLDQWPDNLLKFHEAFTDWKKEVGLLDFTDLLEKCLHDFEEAPGQPAAIFYDEAQDASQLQADLLAQWGQHCRRLVLAGDDDQAIYFWAGADFFSFLDFPCPEGHRRYLRQSYRVPAAVQERANAWVRQLAKREDKDYAPRQEQGFVRTCAASYYRPEAAVDMAEEFCEEGKTVMFEAACSYMLDPLKAVLRKRGLPFHNPWRQKRGDWNPLARGDESRTMPLDRLLAFLRPDPDTWGEDASMWRRRDLWAWADLLEARGSLVRGAKKELAQLKKDGTEITPALARSLLLPERLAELDGLPFDTHEGRVQAIRWWLSLVLEKEKPKLEYASRVYEVYGGRALQKPPPIVIGTGHSLKGSEADVCFIFPDLSRAGFEAWCWGGEEREGIIRLFYVMLTRAREGLVLCQPATMQKVALS